MEKEIRENDYVVIVCTPNYRQKSNERQGGVGYEGDIITAEILSRGNQRKFIPILARGIWKESAPTWSKGKFYVDLSTPEKYEANYSILLNALLGTQPAIPPLKAPSGSARRKQRAQSEPDEPIRITEIITDEITEPIVDGTPGSALYAIPFRLNRRPSSLWTDVFLQKWDHPPRFTTMHRPGIARVQGMKIILDGTTIEEIDKYHRETLLLCVNATNEEVAAILERQRRTNEARDQWLEEHRKQVRDTAKKLSFD